MERGKKRKTYNRSAARRYCAETSLESECTVALVTKLDPRKAKRSRLDQLAHYGGARKLHPMGLIGLEVHGRTFNVQRVGGKWPTLQL